MDKSDMKLLRAARRARAMQDAEAKATWSGGKRMIPDKKKAASKRACRDWRYE